MKKKLFGNNIGTFFTIIICLIVAVIFWFFVEFFSSEGIQLLNSVSS